MKKIMDEANPLLFDGPGAWRKWLAAHYDNEQSAWVVHFKKNAAAKGLRYQNALDEALCYGWIDGKMKSIDDEKFMLRYTPRKKNSKWSRVNRDKAEALIKQGRVTDAGLSKIEEARSNGKWEAAYSAKEPPVMPDELEVALKKNKTAHANFHGFANSYKNTYIYWVNDAKTDPTRKKRIDEVVKRASKNQKPGM